MHHCLSPEITLSPPIPSHSYFLAFCCFLALQIVLIGMYVSLPAYMHAGLRDLMRFSDDSSSSKISLYLIVVKMTPVFNLVD